jgi:hypothetical protein
VAVRKFLIGQALESFSALCSHINDMTEEEVLAALDLECGTNRRRSLIDRLIQRAVRLNEIRYTSQLKEKYHG